MSVSRGDSLTVKGKTSQTGEGTFSPNAKHADERHITPYPSSVSDASPFFRPSFCLFLVSPTLKATMSLNAIAFAVVTLLCLHSVTSCSLSMMAPTVFSFLDRSLPTVRRKKVLSMDTETFSANHLRIISPSTFVSAMSNAQIRSSVLAGFFPGRMWIAYSYASRKASTIEQCATMCCSGKIL